MTGPSAMDSTAQDLLLDVRNLKVHLRVADRSCGPSMASIFKVNRRRVRRRRRRIGFRQKHLGSRHLAL